MQNQSQQVVYSVPSQTMDKIVNVLGQLPWNQIAPLMTEIGGIVNSQNVERQMKAQNKPEHAAGKAEKSNAGK